ncbi:UDP-N-acetylmuramoyl-L-alanyl-D-glutamate--2,6-diaminopimelate ligase [Camelimonas lactis]|uniref:UDP-N-acetylmuramoyl-L-alanyl-D-glutamate--2,6-diaminopimelate ligase n=1 Tax=Camelimonas lactis TaxID=659006 RepID=A0A4R2GZF2_9HYPH|nr:UDP-N-acetylmuramoylalanyl-D-glutamate--2,6-diaminopimelate ligase [Camelimonas lactis]
MTDTPVASAPPVPAGLEKVFPGLFTGEMAARTISEVTADSRAVVPGAVFVAVAGARDDGRRFVADAAARGAIAIVGEGPRPDDLPQDVAWGQAPNARHALALAAAALYPAQPPCIVAVTGTAGKSSVVDFARQLFTACGRKAASLGTVGVIGPSGATYGSLTTPDPVTLHRTLATLAAEGVTHLAMEASSHGLDQRRLDGVRLQAAAFTNLGRDHLDYHPDEESYFDAKARLFSEVAPASAAAVVNADSSHGQEILVIASTRGMRTLTVGESGADIQLLGCAPDGFDQQLSVSVEGAAYDLRLPLCGDFQAQNALIAAGLCIATGEEPDVVMPALANLQGVPGRMERVAEVNGALVVVDYAHKPDALREVLKALRPFASGRLVCVFGAGGDRDPGKRKIMGEIAAKYADQAIVTDDNPRSEDPAAIRAAILAGAPEAREIGDRGEAIATAIAGLQAGDVLVIAGKGHETGQTFGQNVLPFSDHEAVRAAIRKASA